jgi:hypothetical protein
MHTKTTQSDSGNAMHFGPSANPECMFPYESVVVRNTVLSAAALARDATEFIDTDLVESHQVTSN